MTSISILHKTASPRKLGRIAVALCLLVVSATVVATEFDQTHGAWNALLSSNVQWTHSGGASVVDYAGFAKDKPKLDAYLESLSAVSKAQFDGWTKPQRRAFLINGYNAFTIDLILTKYPDLKSIKDLGSLFSSPWKKEFFDLLGSKRSLDDIEQTMIRGASDYDDPRIHFAVNCASIGCPALRPEAYVADKLDAQLDDQASRFLSDSSRTKLDSRASTLTLSMIFKWYAGDFGKGYLGAHSVQEFLARYPDALHASADDVAKLKKGGFTIGYSDYDWSLNRAK